MNDLPAILVVEDDHLIQSVVEEALKEGGFEIAIAASARQAIELLDTAGGKYRALVTDINLGRDQVDGWGIARHAREIDPEFPVVLHERRQHGGLVIQGRSEQHHAVEAVRAGPTGHRDLQFTQQR